MKHRRVRVRASAGMHPRVRAAVEARVHNEFGEKADPKEIDQVIDVIEAAWVGGAQAARDEIRGTLALQGIDVVFVDTGARAA